MNPVFNLFSACKRSILEITSNVPSTILAEYLIPYRKEKIPESVTFKVAAGKKGYDLIRLFQSGEIFFSKKFIDVLAQFVDMSNKCYPIKIEGIEEQYYVICNLDEYPYLNKDKALFNEEPHFYCGEKIETSFFGITNTRLFVVTEDIKNALVKNKVTNIYFKEAFLCTEEEYKEWQRNG
ncbi:hypothetical protein [Xylanibacter ruminicola]|uniref:Immunity protein 43 n=1 Tax=Xylanibacter ruminicola TaxID=839 RepID=A0A1M6ZFH7_XYLRU|nr:hypothetical protein [Xylanibacter ruminicola]SHL29256.1 hypothetical protein SAMN05216463_1611 [Xylanibacter ruminicola]